MNDREALTAALAALDEQARIEWVLTDHFAEVEQAARERLAQLPEKCATRHYYDGPHRDDCPTCHGSGKVYPAELVELIGKTIFLSDHFVDGPIEAEALAVVVLDALNDQPSTVRTTTDGTSRV